MGLQQAPILVGSKKSMAHQAFVADVDMALAGCTTCWAHHVITCLHSADLGAAEHLSITDKINYYIKLVVPVEELCQQMADRFDCRWAEVAASSESDPRSIDGCGVKAHRYARWMGLPFTQGEESCWLAHADVVMRPKLHQTLMRFRLLCWDLEVNRPQGRDRACRTCRICGDAQAVEDELHVLCECPAYESIRDRYESDLHFKERDMRSIMLEAPPIALASFLDEVWRERHCILQRCTRLAARRVSSGD